MPEEMIAATATADMDEIFIAFCLLLRDLWNDTACITSISP